MIEERAAERTLKEVIGQHVLPRERIQRRAAVVVVSHREAARVAPCGVAVVLAAVDLHLMLEEPMHQIARDRRGGERDARLRGESMLDREGSVRQTRALGLRDHGHVARGGHAAPRRRQRLEHRAVAVALPDIGGERLPVRVEHFAQAHRTGKIAIQIVEGAVLGIDHDDGRDLRAQSARDRLIRAVGGVPGAPGAGATTVDEQAHASTAADSTAARAAGRARRRADSVMAPV